ncbi:MAG: GNAT family N-acetyltransferase [Verrucomicrobiales bacterium]
MRHRIAVVISPQTFSIRQPENRDEIARCFEVLCELRPHLEVEEFVRQVERQRREHGYALVLLESEGVIRAVAGFRLCECLAWGRFLYVDDLCTRASDQRRGFGSWLFDWLVQFARNQGCQQLHLDSGLQRHAAHRFYARKGMDLTSHHYAMKL